MNFLAHLRLAGSRDEALLGGMLGDFVKGSPEGRFSAGVAEIRSNEAIQVAIARADKAMYVAKKAGKNRVEPAA